MPCRIIAGYVSQKYIIAALFCWVPVTCRVWSTRSWTVNSPPYKAATVGIGEWWYLVATVPSSESKCSHLEHLRNLYLAGITVPPFLCPSMDNTGSRDGTAASACCTHEDPNWGPQHLQQRKVWRHTAWNPGEADTGGHLGLAGQIARPNQYTRGLTRDYISQSKVESDYGSCSHPLPHHTHRSTQVYTCLHRDAYTHTHKWTLL